MGTKKPAAKSAAPNPAAKSAAAKPAARNAGPKQGSTTVAAKPAVKNAAVKPTAKNAAVKPTAKNAAVKPTAKNAAVKPAAKNTAAKPAAKTATAKHVSPSAVASHAKTPSSESTAAVSAKKPAAKGAAAKFPTKSASKFAPKSAAKSAATKAVPPTPPDVADPKVTDDLSTRLLAFATRRARLLLWWLGDAGALAKDNTVQDVVLDAMSRLYGGEHRWDPTRYPDPFVYLVLVVKTKLWNLAVSSESRLGERGVDDAALDEITTPEMLLLEIEVDNERRARASRTASALASEFANDEEFESLHELMIKQGVREPQDLAPRLNKPVSYVNKLKKRLARAWECVATRLETECDNG